MWFIMVIDISSYLRDFLIFVLHLYRSTIFYFDDILD